jgi:hypothetical protein
MSLAFFFVSALDGINQDQEMRNQRERCWSMHATQRYVTTGRKVFPIIDVEHDDLNGLPATITRRLIHEDRLYVVTPVPHQFEYVGETPCEGEGAVTRWLDLYDRALQLRTELQALDLVATRTALRAVNSLFLYEHQLTAKTRYRVRRALWHREYTDVADFIT